MAFKSAKMQIFNTLLNIVVDHFLSWEFQYIPFRIIFLTYNFRHSNPIQINFFDIQSIYDY